MRCPNCNGSGTKYGQMCPTCEGKGNVFPYVLWILVIAIMIIFALGQASVPPAALYPHYHQAH